MKAQSSGNAGKSIDWRYVLKVDAVHTQDPAAPCLGRPQQKRALQVTAALFTKDQTPIRSEEVDGGRALTRRDTLLHLDTCLVTSLTIRRSQASGAKWRVVVTLGDTDIQSLNIF